MKQIGVPAQIATKYAIAFMSIFSKHLSSRDYEALDKFECFLQEHPHVMLVFRMPLFDEYKKKKFLNVLVQSFDLPDSVQALCRMLLSHGRIVLLGLVLSIIKNLYRDEQKTMVFSISGSDALRPEQLKVIQNFLARKTGRTILYTYTVDTALISGIRAQSDTLLWECSIRQRLRIAHRALLPV